MRQNQQRRWSDAPYEDTWSSWAREYFGLNLIGTALGVALGVAFLFVTNGLFLGWDVAIANPLAYLNWTYLLIGLVAGPYAAVPLAGAMVWEMVMLHAGSPGVPAYGASAWADAHPMPFVVFGLVPISALLFLYPHLWLWERNGALASGPLRSLLLRDDRAWGGSSGSEDWGMRAKKNDALEMAQEIKKAVRIETPCIGRIGGRDGPFFPYHSDGISSEYFWWE